MPVLLRQLIVFSIAGTTAAAVDFGGYFALTRLVAVLRTYYVATSVATSVAATVVGYAINRRWTFRDPDAASAAQYGQYLLVYGVGVVWQNTLLAVFVERFGLLDILAKLAAILTVAFLWNFTLAKFWVFRYTRT